MKRFFFIATLCTLMFFSLTAVYAGSLNDWTNLPGYKSDGELGPAKLVMTSEGLQFTLNGGYYTDNGYNSGIILNQPVAPGNFSVEFIVEEVAGSAAEGDDLWIGVHLLNKKEYFSIGNPAQSSGMVSLLRPSTDKLNVSSFEHVDSFKLNNYQDIPVNPIGKMNIEFKKNEDSNYTYFLNGTALKNNFNLSDTFADDKAYFVFGASTDNGGTFKIILTKINGIPLASDENPATGDFGMVPYAVLAMVSGLAYVKKRRHCQ